MRPWQHPNPCRRPAACPPALPPLLLQSNCPQGACNAAANKGNKCTNKGAGYVCQCAVGFYAGPDCMVRCSLACALL